MHLVTRGSDYALRGLMFMAQQTDDRRILLKEISEAEGIPEAFLAKIFRVLAKAGVVRSYRGTGGGYQLGAAPEAITVRQVVEACDGPVAVSWCLLDESRCIHSTGCAIVGTWWKAQRNLMDVLEGTTLADLLARSGRLQAIEPAPSKALPMAVRCGE